jgi:hypothetical protein
MNDAWVAAAWMAVIASGLYHGLNPAMGWPLAVAAGMFERRPRALALALGSLTAGHLLAMLALVLPFALLVALAQWERPIRIAAACAVLAFGVLRLLRRRHPRALSRIAPSRLGLWSFVAAVAHGAGLMLVPIFLGMCRPMDTDTGHQAAATLMTSNLGMALSVALVHSAAMLAAGGGCAWLTYRYLGLASLRSAWRDTDALWTASLLAVGTVALVTAV